MRQGAIDGVETFLSVARHRNFRRAAAELGVSPSAVSQSIRALEARIGAALFLRTTRSVGLTEAGEAFLARAGPAYEQLAAAGEEARALGRGPSGRLRLSVPRAAVAVLIDPLVASFQQACPDVEVELSASEELVDLAAGGFDAGVRFGQLIAADMVAIRLTPPFRMVVVGSPAYFTRLGRPDRPGALRDHACLRLRRSGGALASWTFDDDGTPVDIDVTGPFIANDYPTLLGAALSGTGLAQLPAPVAAEAVRSGKLETVLADVAPTVPGMFLYYPDRRQVLPKLRAFIDHAKTRYAAGSGSEAAACDA
jgi:DNA-binding transcriptional LysR family regulator